MSNIPNDKRQLDFGSAFAIQDPDTLKIIQEPLELDCLIITYLGLNPQYTKGPSAEPLPV